MIQQQVFCDSRMNIRIVKCKELNAAVYSKDLYQMGGNGNQEGGAGHRERPDLFFTELDHALPPPTIRSFS